jgi:TonB family protein
MYFDFEDYHPDIQPVGRAISWREGVLLSIIVHLAMIIVILLFPRWFPFDEAAARARMHALEVRQAEQQPQFVFVQPRLERAVPKPPDRGDASDRDRLARAPEKAERPTNPLPFARGNTPERVEEPPKQMARGRGPDPDPAAGQPSQNTQPSNAQRLPDSQSALQLPPQQQAPQNGLGGRAPAAGGSLGDALRNLERYTRSESFDNQGGGGGQFGPEIQFDTKGVEFGPWIRRFIAQVKRNWFIPYAAMGQRGHTVITFNVHKDGSITDISVAGPSPIEPFNTAAFGALSGSNPTQPLPPEYPADKAFFTVTFFYNEVPPR